MKANKQLVLTLEEKEYLVLKKLLGSMTDNEFGERGIRGNDREILRVLWEEIPYSDDD